MGKPISLLEEGRAFARDFARDRMPKGYLWDLVDYVPSYLDAQLTGRGGWKWASAVGPADFLGGIYATFKKGDKLLGIDAGAKLQEVNLTDGTLTDRGAVHTIVQNPIQHQDFVIIPQGAGTAVPKYVTWDGVSAPVIKDMHSSAFKGRYAATFKGFTVLANAVGLEERIAFSPPDWADPDPLVAPDNTGKPDLLAWDDKSYINTQLPVSGIGALRAVVLVFHAGSVERIRGTVPPYTGDGGDMFREPLYDRAGCGDARSIAYWQDNCIFADERGVHMTDGAIVRNLASQGGILYFWRTLYRNRLTVCADTFLDYYVITVIRTDGVAVTLVCDLQRRSWMRFTNIRAQAYIHSIGSQEQLWGCRQGAQRLVSISNCFFPVPGLMVDDDGTPVLPSFETPWYRLAEEGRKRVRFGYVSYDLRLSATDLTRGTEPELEVAAAWREPLEDWEQSRLQAEAKAANGTLARAMTQALELGYITSPHDLNYQIAGRLPDTTRYSRYRLPLNKNPYGIAFRVRQLVPSYVTRVYDLAVEAQSNERSRI